MLNQTSEELTVAYVENYLDSVENLPDDIQRFLSKMHELDISYRNYLKDLRTYKELLEKEDLELGAQKKALYKFELILISLQEVGDEKVEIAQQINDLIDAKYRSLDTYLKRLDVYKEIEPTDSLKDPVREANIAGANRADQGIDRSNSNGSGERASKRARRTRAEAEPVDPPPAETRSSGGAGSNNSSGNKSASGAASGAAKAAAANNKKKKRKCRQREETPPREEEVVHDIDEPTYCLCDQISYGEMILCDNDLCPIEWFHFVCVSLTTKPKGKWFCPKCRGDKPNVMKPKSQFLKELERYNKEKEEKAST